MATSLSLGGRDALIQGLKPAAVINNRNRPRTPCAIPDGYKACAPWMDGGRGRRLRDWGTCAPTMICLKGALNVGGLIAT